jgi:carbamoyltransferase
MLILGLSAFYHESACCLLRDGQLIAAAAEERFSRVKHDPRLPVEAFRFCLQEAGIGPGDLDAIAYYEEPVQKLSRQLWCGPPEHGPEGYPWLDPGIPVDMIRQRLGFTGPLLSFPHHLSHAASAFHFSGYEEAAILTVDGVGEWATSTYGKGEPEGINLFEEVLFPHSLGLLYSTLTAYLGFRVNGGEYKVMGLAPYGEANYVDQICQLVGMGPGGQYRLNLPYFDFIAGQRMYSPALPELFGLPPRQPEAEIEQAHRDIARSLQLVLEEILLEKVTYLHREVPSAHLCMAGGVALNCVANGRIHREGPFEHLFVQPAAGDSGACLGAATLAHQKLSTRLPRRRQVRVDLGPRFDSTTIAGLLDSSGLTANDYREHEAELLTDCAQRLADGEVVAWFHGRMEFGPRALGGRSILANPMLPDMRQRLNQVVKKREGFRPFAPSVLAEHAAEHFALEAPSPFMLQTCQVRSPLDLPGITHVDGSARPQTVDRQEHPRYAALLDAFHQLTGCPILINTSFNVRGEPIVHSPVDALFCFALSGIDTLVLEDFLLDRSTLPASLPALLAAWEHSPQSTFHHHRSALQRHLYTFV